MSDDDADDLKPELVFLQQLHDLGAVLWIGDEGYDGGCSRPLGWQNLTCDENEARLERFHLDYAPYICANTGILVAVVDVDTKNGGDVEKVRALLAMLGVRIFAEVNTPSGGVHFYIKGHPNLVSTHSTEANQMLPGYPGLDIQSHGCNVFTPGTVRRKYGFPLDPYGIVFNHLDQLALLDEDDDGGTGALADWVAEQRAKSVKTKARKAPGGAREWTWDPCEPWSGGTPDKRQQAYLDTALAGEADKVATTAKGGRNDALFTAALKLGSYIAGAGLDEQKVITALEEAAVTNGYTADDGLFATRASIASGLRAGCKNPRAVPPPSTPGPSASVDLESFWELTDTLRHVRDFAHARLVGPWAVLGVALARVVAVVPPTVQLPPWVGDNASLNLFIALIGVSGQGKGAPEKAAKAAFRLGPVYTTGIGSGQGNNHLFAHYDGKAKKTVMDRWSVYFSVPEVDNIASERGRTGSNLLPQLRKAWDGSDLTFGYADRTKGARSN